MSYPMIFLAVAGALVVGGMLCLAIFAWGEWNSNPHPDDDYEGF